MSEQNKTLARRLYEEVVNQHNLEIAHVFCPPDYVHHDPSLPGANIHGLDNYLNVVSGFFIAFPDLRVTVDDVIAEGDKVVTRWTWTGTHQGELMGIAPTGKKVTVSAISIHRAASGKLAEGWVNFDAMGMLQQLGVVPTSA